MTAKVVLITGCSSGIGRATALAAAKAGWTVVATMRSPQPLADLEVRQLDVTSSESIADCLQATVEAHGRLDAVVNNAGLARLNTMELDTMVAMRAVMEVNFFGAVAVSRAAMPLLRQSRGRLVTLGAVRGVIGQPFNEVYSASKFAIEGFMESLAPVAARVGVRVSIVEPGAVDDTSFAANAGLDPAGLVASAGAYEPALLSYFDWVGAQLETPVQTPDEIAACVLHALEDPEPPFRIPTNEWARDYLALKLADVSGAAVQTMTRGFVGG